MVHSMTARSQTGGIEGVDYQLHIIAWTLFRAHEWYNGEYEIYSEMVDAGKFDDVVLVYKDSDDDEERYRFLQAKHARDEAKKNISLKDLTMGNKFNVMKYFESFKQIVSNDKFKDKVQDVILYSNLDINKDLDPYLKVVQEEDPIFQFKILKMNQRKPQFYKLKSNFIETYRNGILHDLANALVDSCSNPESSSIINYKDYHGILLKDVYNVEQNQFRPDFIEGKGLSTVTEMFRDILKQKVGNIDRDSKDWMRSVKLTISTKLAKPDGRWPTIFDMDIDSILFHDFCNKFILAANQPNESELSHYLTAANELDVDIIELKEELRVWFKDYNYPLTDNFVDEPTSCKEINQNKRELFEQQIEFIDDGLQTELMSFLRQHEMKVLQIITDVDSVVATSIKLQTHLKKQSIYNYLFPPTDNKRELNKILEIFSKSKRYHLLIWETHHCPIDFSLLKRINFRSHETKKIIIVCDNKLQMSAADVRIDDKFLQKIDDETRYDQLTDATRTRLESKTVEFQGEKLQLNQICTFDHFRSDMSWTHLIKKDIVFGAKPKVAEEYKTENYIHRTMVAQYPYFHRSEIPQMRNQLNFELDEGEFENNNKQNPGKVVHLFREQNDKIIWQKSTRGGIRQLKELKLETSTQSISDSNMTVFDAHQKVLILMDPAGMGKTVASSHLAERFKKLHRNDWVVRLVAMECARILSEFTDSRQLNELLILRKLMHLQSSIEDSIFGQYLRNDHSESKLIIIFDGYDEIDEHCQAIILRVLQYLSEKPNVRLIGITTRPHHQDQLEEAFQQFVFTLTPFSKDNKIDFLVKFWKLKFNLVASRAAKLRSFAVQLIEKVTESISDNDCKMTGIPLQMRMLGEVYADAAEEYLENSERIALERFPINLYSLYENFIQIKRNVFSSEKTKTRGLSFVEDKINSDFRTMGKYARQIILFDNEVSDEELDKTIYLGIVQKYGEGSYNFIHRTFAEFLIAQHLLGDFILHDYLSPKEKLAQSNFVEKLTNKDLGVVRKFINCKLNHDELFRLFKDCNQSEIKDYFAGKWRKIVELSLEEETHEILKFILDMHWLCDGEEMRDHFFNSFEYLGIKFSSLDVMLNWLFEKRFECNFDRESLLNIFKKVVSCRGPFLDYKEFNEVVIRYQLKLESSGILQDDELNEILNGLDDPACLSSLRYLTYLQSKPDNFMYELLREGTRLTEYDEYYSDESLRSFLTTLFNDPVFVSQYFHNVFIVHFERYSKSHKYHIFSEFIGKYLRKITEEQLGIFIHELSDLNLCMFYSNERRVTTHLQFCFNNREILPLQNILDEMKIFKKLSLVEHCALWGFRETLGFILDAGDEIEVPPIELMRSNSLSANIQTILNHIVSHSPMEDICGILSMNADCHNCKSVLSHAVEHRDSLRLDIFASFIVNEEIFDEMLKRTNCKDVAFFFQFTVQQFPQYKMKIFETKKNELIHGDKTILFNILNGDKAINADELLQIFRLKNDKNGDTLLHSIVTCQPMLVVQ